MTIEDDIDFSKSLKSGTIGYAMRNPPQNRVSKDAAAFVRKLPSIGELFLTNGTSFAREFSETVEFERTGTLECADATYSYGITADGAAVIANCVIKVPSITVPAQIEDAPVVVAGAHSFSTCYGLEAIELPACLEEIHGYAFMNTALRGFSAPASLRYIGAKAFYKCKQLESVDLGERLLSIGDAAFRESAVVSAVLPANLEAFGQGVFDGTGIRCDGQGLRVAQESERFCLHAGALYEAVEGGWVLLQLIDEDAQTYDGADAVAALGGPLLGVAERAFADRRALRAAFLPDGVVTIGEAAFRGCRALAEVRLPDTLETLGRRAFWETALPQISIPASLTDAGTAAFHTGGTVSSSFAPTVRTVTVAPGNPVYYVRDGMLCARRPEGGVCIVLYTGQGTDGRTVVIPPDATMIGPYAFSNVKGLASVRFHSGIETVDISGFDFGSVVPSIIYDERETGRSYTLRFPSGERSYMHMRQAFGLGSFDIEDAFGLLDRAIMSVRDPFERARAMLDRLLDPVFLQPAAERQYCERLRGMLSLAVVEFGRNGYPQGIDELLEVGALREDNIEEAIGAAQEAGEIAVLSRLIELRRTAFGAALFDFDL